MLHSFIKNEQKCQLLKIEKHKNACKTPPKPHGVLAEIPHPRGFSKSIPHPHGGGAPIPHGDPMGGRGGGKPYVANEIVQTAKILEKNRLFFQDF